MQFNVPFHPRFSICYLDGNRAEKAMGTPLLRNAMPMYRDPYQLASSERNLISTKRAFCSAVNP
jgi:hypothetical protein